MRIVYMGTPEYARIVLEKLVDSEHEVALVVAGEDAISKRGNKKIPCPVKEFALSKNIEVITPHSLKDEEVQRQIKDAKPDVICVAAYGKILTKELLDIPPKGCLNVHASLLPRWRGAAPIERAILEGDAVLGVAIMKMEEGLDTGDFYTCGVMGPFGKSATEISNALASVGGSSLVYVLDHIDSVTWEAQEEDQVTYAHKIEKGELNIDPDENASTNLSRVLASSDSHPSKCVIAGKTCRIISVERDLNAFDPILDGWVLKPDYKGVKFENGNLYLDGLKVTRLKPDGKNEMDGKAFAAGNQAVREGKATWEKC